MNLGFIVNAEDLPNAVQRLHHEFFVAQGHALPADAL